MPYLREATFQAVVNVLAMPVRLVGNAIAVALGVAVLVTSLALSSTTERQVAADFDVLRATEVRVTDSKVPGGFPADYETRLLQLAGVEEVERLGGYGIVRVGTHSNRRSDLGGTLTAALYGVDTGGPSAVSAVVDGHLLDASLEAVDARQVLVGGRLAASLDLRPLDGIRAVWINDRPFAVRGIIVDGGSFAALMDGLVVLNSEAASFAPGDIQVLLRVAPGAAASVADQATLALRPEDPSSLQAIAPPDPGSFRLQIEGQIRTALLAVAGITSLVGGLVIANTMALAVVARRAEIGLKRALGASGSEVFVQFLTESTILGMVGGIIGASLGILATVGIAVGNGWNPVINLEVPILGLLVGVLIGAIAGVIPSLRAVRLDPIEALRSSA